MSVHKAITFSFLDRYASLALSIGSSMVIARLLTPGEIGVFSVTMVLLAFLGTVRDLGAGEYLVQERQLTPQRIQAVWAVQLGLGLTFATIVLIAAFPVASFYDEPKMKDIMVVIAANYAINPFGSLTYAHLMREMRFDLIALIRFSGTFAGTVVSVLLAWRGYGAISLAVGMFASTLVSAVTSVYFRPRSFPWLPGTAEIRRVLSFGTKLTSSSLLNTLASNTPELMLGKLHGMVAAGLYSRSSGLVAMFSRLITDPIMTVAMSLFSKQQREQGQFTAIFLKATSYLTALGWSFCVSLVLLAHPAMRVLYGSQWDDSVDLARILAIGYIVGAPVALSAVALIASGDATRVFRATAISLVITVILAVVGATFGPNTLAWSMSTSSAISALVWMASVKITVKFRWRELFDVLARSALVAGMSAFGPLMVFLLLGAAPHNSVGALALGIAGCVVGFLTGVIVLSHPLKEELRPMWAKILSRISLD